jgi:transposase-like protein
MPPPRPGDFPTADADRLLRTLVRRRGVEGGVRGYFETLRWPEGVECPRCESARITVLELRRKYYCLSCRYQFRVTVRTLLQDTHIPLWKWLVAVDLMMTPDQACPVAELQETIGGSEKTAWFLTQRIRAAIAFSAEPNGVDAAASPSEPGVVVLRSGTRGPSAKYRDAFVQEALWKAAHRGRESRFRATVQALLGADPLTYRLLITHGLRATA